MRIDIATLFPGMFSGPFDESIVRRARDRGLVDIRCHDIRDYADAPYRQVDDYMFGGGAGMLMKAEPLDRLLHGLLEETGEPARLLMMSPQGGPFTQQQANGLAEAGRLVIICGHYKGVDERIRIKYRPEEVSVGDYVLSGGEIAAMAVVDAVVRLLPGAVEHEDSVLTDSFQKPRLDCPHYTRPRVYGGMEVPEVLLSGDHARIAEWRLRESLARTARVRPELLEKYPPDDAERKALGIKKKKRN